MWKKNYCPPWLLQIDSSQTRALMDRSLKIICLVLLDTEVVKKAYWRWKKVSVCYNYYKSLVCESIVVCVWMLKSVQIGKYLQKCATGGRGFWCAAKTTRCYMWVFEYHVYEFWKLLFTELQYCHICFVVLFISGFIVVPIALIKQHIILRT
jgi:hypothetical protein